MYEKMDSHIDNLANKVIGAAIEVHKILGPGYLENIYEQALAKELYLQGIPFEQQKAISLLYKDHIIGEGRVDFLIDNTLVLELKAIEYFNSLHTAQVLSYLKVLRLPLGLLINFNVPNLQQE